MGCCQFNATVTQLLREASLAKNYGDIADAISGAGHDKMLHL
jgi:hypothetical protein